LLGEVVDGIIHLSLEGGVVTECWESIGEHSATARPDILGVMPNHVHGILWLLGFPSTADQPNSVGARHASPPRTVGNRPSPGALSLSAIVGSFKSATSRRINLLRGTPGAQVWQRGFYEHVIRTDTDLDRIREYLEANPSCWPSDKENPECQPPNGARDGMPRPYE